jgi:hypothetical protein
VKILFVYATGSYRNGRNERDKKRRAPTCCGLLVGALNLGALSDQNFASAEILAQAVHFIKGTKRI